MKQIFFIVIFLLLGFAGFCQEAVDLGLSVKWATCNVGAKSSWEYGDFYTFDEAQTLADSDWRVPTDEELQELIDKCTWTWTSLNGVNGCRVTGKNENSIFLPAAGLRNDFGVYRFDGHYWSSSAGDDYVFCLDIYGDGAVVNGDDGYSGQSVRLVQDVK